MNRCESGTPDYSGISPIIRKCGKTAKYVVIYNKFPIQTFVCADCYQALDFTKYKLVEILNDDGSFCVAGYRNNGS